MNFKITKTKGIIIIAVTLILMIVASQISIPDGANDPLNLIDYTPEQKAELAANSEEWQAKQTLIESNNMANQQLLSQQAGLSQKNEQIRISVQSKIQATPFQ